MQFFLAAPVWRAYAKPILLRVLGYGSLLGIGLWWSLPPLISTCACAGPETTAKLYLGSFMRAQQAKYADAGQFAASIADLELGWRTETEQYRYESLTTATSAIAYSLPQEPTLRSYTSATFVLSNPDPATGDNTITILCRSHQPGLANRPALPYLAAQTPHCGAGSEPLQ